MRRYLLIAGVVWLVDQLIKLYIRQFPVYAVPFSLPNLFDITHCINSGAAFSLLSGYTVLIALFSISLLVFLVLYLVRDMHLNTSAKISLSVLIGGGLGNLTDRLLLGGVTDYIRLQFINFPVFNFADICITLSVCVLCINLLTERMDKHSGEKHGSDH